MWRKPYDVLPFLCLAALLFTTAAAADAARATRAGSWLDAGSGSPEGTAPTVEIIGRGENTMDVRLTLPGLRVGAAGRGYVRLEIPGQGALQGQGEPAVPVFSRLIALPPGASAEVSLLGRDSVTYDLGARLVPAQPPRSRCCAAPPALVVDEAAYGKASPFPKAHAAVDGVGQIRSQRLARLELHPVRYLPASGRIEVARRMDVRITFKGAERRPPARDVAAFSGVYGRLLGWVPPAETRGAPPVPEQMLVITSQALAEEVLPLVVWRIRRGVRVLQTVLPDGATVADVQSVAQQAYDDSEGALTYILLVGDEDEVPVNVLDSYMDWDGEGESDYVYSLLDGTDDYADVLMGRLAAGDADQLAVQVARIVRYEKDVGRTDPVAWIDGMTGIGSNGSAGGPTDGDRIDDMADIFETYGYAEIDRFLEQDGWQNEQDISDAVNAGRGWVLFLGHGSGEGWYLNESWDFAYTNDYVEALTNTGWPIVVDVACNNGDFTHFNPGFSEVWVQAGSASQPYGAIGILSSTTSAAWDEPAEMATGMVKAFLEDDVSMWGEVIAEGMNYMEEQLGSTSTVLESKQMYINFGDPALILRSRTPRELAVAHAATAEAESTFGVDVEALEGDAGVPVEDAVVALSNGAGVVGVALTDSAGAASFALGAEGGEGFDVVVTGFDLVTYEGEVNGGGADPEPEEGPDPGTTDADTDSDTDTDTDSDTDTDTDTDSDSDSDSDADTDTGTEEDAGTGLGDYDDGCGCAAAGQPGRAVSLLGIFAGII